MLRFVPVLLLYVIDASLNLFQQRVSLLLLLIANTYPEMVRETRKKSPHSSSRQYSMYVTFPYTLALC